MDIVLFQPQLPSNKGNIVRICHAPGSDLILVRLLGFQIDDRSLRRADLDYWEGVKVTIIDDLIEYLVKLSFPFYFLSIKGEPPYSNATFKEKVILIFGSEV